jgi:hypothetical protein
VPDEVVLDQDLQEEVGGALISNVELMLAFDVQDELHSQHPTQQARHPRLSFIVPKSKYVFCFGGGFGFCASFPIIGFSVVFVNVDSCPESEDCECLGSYTSSEEVLHSFGVLFVSHACSPEEGKTCCRGA